ncbi:MAG: toll/interleukin-1 receptor domain-containing protein [Thermoleophilia bacterium]
MSDTDEFEYDIALSFAGEDRSVVDELAGALTQEGVRVFYDDYEKAQLWGKDLYQHLQAVYRDHARYCAVFVSAAYARKLWTRHELKQAQARAFKESREYILPIRLDDTEIPGLNATVGYIDLRHHSIAELNSVILQKLFGRDVEQEDLPELTWQGERVEFRGDEVASFWPQKLATSQSITRYVCRLPRIRYGDESSDWRADEFPCHDCAAIKGEYHVPGCDVEECPVCHGQALGCECIEGEASA